MQDQQGQVQETRLNPRWLLKMGIFFVFLFGLGIWGWYDATIKYPERGREHAEFMLKNYLETAREEGQLLRASVPDPAAEYRRLLDQDNALGPVESQRLNWLKSLSRVYSLDQLSRRNEELGSQEGSLTIFADPAARLAQLQQEWQNKPVPSGLNDYDIPVQYLIMFTGFALSIWVVFVFFTAATKKYRFEPDSHTILLPGGKRIEPASVTEVDKRKWHKFYVTIRLEDGSAHTLDLYRYTPLEDWVLEMEKHTPGYVPPEEAEEDVGDRAEQGGGPESSTGTGA